MRVTLDMPDKLHCELKQKAAEEKTTMREIILRSLKEHLQTSRKRKLPHHSIEKTGTASSGQ